MKSRGQIDKFFMILSVPQTFQFHRRFLYIVLRTTNWTNDHGYMRIPDFHMFLAALPCQKHTTIYSGQGFLAGAYLNILDLAPARLGHCGDATDAIFEILLAALKYTLARFRSPRCISGPPGVFQPISRYGALQASPSTSVSQR